MKNLLCFLMHNWEYNTGDAGTALYRKCIRCGKFEVKSLRGNWVDGPKELNNVKK